MSNSLITTDIFVNNNKIGIMRVGNVDYISLTDIAKHKDNGSRPADIIRNWLRNRNTLEFISTWEEIYNNDFKVFESEHFRINAGLLTFTPSISEWINKTNAIGFVVKIGKNGGTYAHPDIAFEFASILSPSFKLYLIQEFERLKKNEYYQNKIEWNASRLLSKANYLVHTEAIKNYIIPKVSEDQIRITYADEADVLNVALFGLTAKEWRDKHPDLKDEGNIRDYTDMIHLIILSNLENINANLIQDEVNQADRLVRLNNIAINQLELFKNNKSIEELKELETNMKGGD